MNWPPEKIRRVRSWRMLSGFGGLALASSFFLPAIDGCRSPVVPSEQLWEILNESTLDLADVAIGFLWLVAAYLFGLLCFIVAVRNRDRLLEGQWLPGWSVRVLYVMVIATLGTVFVFALVRGQLSRPWNSDEIAALVFFIVSSVYGLRTCRTGAGGRLALRWYAALCCLVWFSFWLVGTLTNQERVYVGLWLSMLGSVCILIAAFKEAQARSSTGCWMTLGKLAIGRLQFFEQDPDGPRCRKCGYLLIGLTTPRCPECGLGFEPGADSACKF